MHDTRTASAERHAERDRIHRRDLFNSLLIGVGLGTILLGAPLGWFAHRIYAQQRTAQVLLCRQQNFGLREADLQARCGQPY
ncbi:MULTISPECIES: hypothetical protein [unclassified Leptolyngbya]|uniref:hypothetical protein n=1 Tax=unclassified Leptolyngbya TaxID=2650499 RepID=UPI00168641F8|nr:MULTISPECIES: hypothetical protein [unclassified Leptolyngbya]MBD1909428.1 hypothetical protein [Leptolyngbya sp. FACHB-8]MBD2158592.1 hypothetical protein [Leptolyngbya sp. FACHB-16]